MFWILDGGTCHQTDKQAMELERLYPNIIVINLPAHASWLNQAAIYVSILARKVLIPNDFESVEDLIRRIIGSQDIYSRVARPFNWQFTRYDLHGYLKSLESAA